MSSISLTCAALSALGFDSFFEKQLENIPSDSIVARVAAEHRDRFDLLAPRGALRAPIVLGLPTNPEGNEEKPAVGDWVVTRSLDPRSDADTVRMVARLQRKTVFARQAAGKRTERQIVAANVDRVFVVTCPGSDFNIQRVERYFAAIVAGGADASVLLNKVDAFDPAEVRSLLGKLHAVAAVSLGVVPISAKTGSGFDVLESLLEPGTTSAFVGSSGVGKSTLVNALLRVERQDTNAVRIRDGRGQHTTTRRELIALSGHGVIVDTPGMREFALWGADSRVGGFDDIEALAERCRFRDCKHVAEPGCAVRLAVEIGELDGSRLEHHHKLEREGMAQLERQDALARHIANKRNRQFSRLVRKAQRLKRG